MGRRDVRRARIDEVRIELSTRYEQKRGKNSSTNISACNYNWFGNN